MRQADIIYDMNVQVSILLPKIAVDKWTLLGSIFPSCYVYPTDMTSAEHLYHQYFDQLYRFALSRSGSVDTAQEAVSRTFYKVVQHLNDFKPQAGATVRSWLFTILRHELTDLFRQTHRITSLEEAETIATTHSLDDYIDQQSQLYTVLTAIHTLPDRQQEIILLRYQTDLKNKEIAQLLAIDEKTVSASLSRAITTLKQVLN